MKKVGLSQFLPVLALAIGIWIQPSTVAQQNDSRAPAAQQQSDAMNQQESKTFTGKIMKSGDKLVLKDSASKSTYQLDDQDKAKAYEGKQVKVTGTVDPATQTIRIASIEPLA